MNIRSLLLGSVAAAGLATGAHAADLAKGVMTSLDVCDALGLSGLTVSSDTNCLQVTGGVSYQFAWGDYKTGAGSQGSGNILGMTPDGWAQIPLAGDSSGTSGRANDWDTQMIAWLQVVGTADSDFGPAKVVIKLKSEQYRHTFNGYGYFDGDDTGGLSLNNGTGSALYSENYLSASHGPSGTVLFDQAYVSVGDSTVLTAGKTGSIVNVDDDTPLNYLGLFNSESIGTGVKWSNNPGATATPFGVQTGGHSIQVVSSLGNGITVKGALEDLNDVVATRAGTAIGVVSYAGENLTAHLSVLATGILDGKPDLTAYHAGMTGTFDKFKLVAAVAGDSSGYYDALASGQVTLDMFKLAGSVEATHIGTGPNAGINGLGVGASASFAVSDGVSLNIGGRYFDTNTAVANTEFYQIAASLVAAVTETITLTGEVGLYNSNNAVYSTGALPSPNPTSGGGSTINTYYGAAQVAWAPGGGFTSSLKGEAYSNGAYGATFNAAKNFQ